MLNYVNWWRVAVYSSNNSVHISCIPLCLDNKTRKTLLVKYKRQQIWMHHLCTTVAVRVVIVVAVVVVAAATAPSTPYRIPNVVIIYSLEFEIANVTWQPPLNSLSLVSLVTDTPVWDASHLDINVTLSLVSVNNITLRINALLTVAAEHRLLSKRVNARSLQGNRIMLGYF